MVLSSAYSAYMPLPSTISASRWGVSLEAMGLSVGDPDASADTASGTTTRGWAKADGRARTRRLPGARPEARLWWRARLCHAGGASTQP